MIKNLPVHSKTFILNLYNKIWKENVFPEKWREALVVPILKPDKNRMKAESYRPISLTNCLCKVLEKIVNNRLVWHLERNNLLYNRMFGFRKHRESTDNNGTLEAEIMDAFTRKENLIAIVFGMERKHY